MVLALLVGIHENEDIIGAYRGHHKYCKGVECCKVLDLKDDGENEPRNRNTNENLKQTHKCQEPRLGVDSDPKEYKNETENCQQCILGNDSKNGISNDGCHEIV